MLIKNLATRALTTACAAFVLLACEKQSDTPAAAATNKEQAPATTVFVNGDIVTLAGEDNIAQALAVRDGRILAVGSEKEVLAAAGSNTTVQDLNGQALLPGFIDAHGHVSMTAKLIADANVASPPVGPIENIDQLVAAMKSQPVNERGWILGLGYDDSLLAEKRHPTRDDLDKVSTEHPVFIRHVSGHLGACNSVCLERAGYDKDTQNPQGGVIRRQAGSSEPDGVLEEAALFALLAVVGEPSEEKQFELLEKTEDYYASFGVTTVQDGAADVAGMDFLAKAAKEGHLDLDVVAYPFMMLMGDNPMPTISKQAGEKFRVGGIKLLLDGSPQGRTAWLKHPYHVVPEGQKEEYNGYPILKDEQVKAFMQQAVANDWQVITHVNGDAAIDQFLRIYEGLGLKAEDDHRWVLIHAQVTRPDQVDSYKRFNLIPSYFVAHTYYWGDWHRDVVLGEERASHISPLAASRDKGVRYTVHNDTPIVPPDMMLLVWTAVNRETRSGKVLGADQRVSTYEALRAVTIDSAYQHFEEQDKGTLEQGKRADLIVLERNPLKSDVATLKDIRVMSTYKDGKLIFSR
jgi:predicted amidohydrolase YtcJ